MFEYEDRETITLCPVDDMAPGSARRFDVDGHRVALVRIDDDFYAIGDRCSHANYSLAEGEVHADDCRLECPKHGSRFSLETGQPDVFPATQPVPTYDVVVRDDEVRLVLP